MVVILHFYLLELILADQLADLPPYSRVICGGQFYISSIRILILADLSPSTVYLTGEAWQFYISTIMQLIPGRSSGRFTPQ